VPVRPRGDRGPQGASRRARQAGFHRVQVQFPWNRADEAFLRALPGWLAAEGLRADVLGAYVNCAVPENVLMDARAADLDRAICGPQKLRT